MSTRDYDRDARTKAARILARSICRELVSHGYDDTQILAVATELISAVTARVRRRAEHGGRDADLLRRDDGVVRPRKGT